jgi:uncharacterized protein
VRKSTMEIGDRNRLVELLTTCEVGRLGTIGREGYPMIKPLNFAYVHEKIYFHTARDGEKIEDIARDSRVCFEIDVPLGYRKAANHACEAGYRYQSVIMKGRAVMVEDGGERLFALDALMAKYQPEGGYGSYLPDKLGITGIVRIDIEEMTGKEQLRG